MDFKKSETYKNLEKAYDGELLAGTKYRIYSRIANKDGFRQCRLSELMSKEPG
ncbi:hypothetical protein CE91St58_09330 [Lachnospiraceae bacterium]|nr:hypothetical protein CE91St58_09330 [Lachnospiraceae bacterium]